MDTHSIGSTQTDASGSFNVAVPYDWSGTITCQSDDFLLVFSPADIVQNNVTGNIISLNFVVSNKCDLDENDIVNLPNFAGLSLNWLLTGVFLDGDFDDNNSANQEDLILFHKNWLWHP